MSLRSDQKALMFLGVVGVLGAGVRVVRAASNEPPQQAQPALERQARAADSAAAADRERRAARGSHPGRGRGGRGLSASRGRGVSRDVLDSNRVKPIVPGAADDHGHVGRRLDLDIATAAQIDSLPGVTPLMARRIAADRVRRGPFLNLNGLRRVTGAGDQFLRKIDTLVTFSGTFARSEPGDTIVKARRKRR
jgi:hypothetical protein